MLLISSKGNTKLQCECGAQSPKIANEDFGAWKSSAEGREFYSRHRPHGKTEAVARGGRVEALDEAVEKIAAKRTKASRQEIDELVQHYNK